ncbi:MAG TPA: hypothetical protein ENI13_00265 [candidate division CPR3 bacterium]|uniref:JAB domain-containing protein n=1 Tax=candidate division CPR3 bacterium TaxID=2268181 RepID=A0A7C1SUH4_UNCC3|nr:hypothetical protein [candidate division CPR3 bacterium]
MEGLTESPKGEAEKVWEGLGKQKVEYVTLPESLLKALYELQKEPRGYEWGGGIDFEIINDEPQIERILAYFGVKAGIPEKVWKKYGPDVEVIFHTHPTQKKVQPSSSDILSFLSSPAQVEFIVAGEEIALFEKTPAFKSEALKGRKLELPFYYEPEIAMPAIITQLAGVGIDVSLYTKSKESPVFDLNIIRQITDKKYLT